jgi:hypothetical protein
MGTNGKWYVLWWRWQDVVRVERGAVYICVANIYGGKIVARC